MYGNTAINYNYAFESIRISILIKTSDEKQTVEAHTYTICKYNRSCLFENGIHVNFLVRVYINLQLLREKKNKYKLLKSKINDITIRAS